MRPDPELVRVLEKKGIRLVIESTSDAVASFNALEGNTRVGACFHVGC